MAKDYSNATEASWVLYFISLIIEKMNQVGKCCDSEPDILSKVPWFTQSHDQNIFCLNNCQADGKLREADVGRKNALHLARLCFYPSKGTEINNALTLW